MDMIATWKSPGCSGWTRLFQSSIPRGHRVGQSVGLGLQFGMDQGELVEGLDRYGLLLTRGNKAATTALVRLYRALGANEGLADHLEVVDSQPT